MRYRRFVLFGGLIAAIVPAANASWPFVTGDWVLTSPSIADINGDGVSEIVFGSADGSLYCLDISGN